MAYPLRSGSPTLLPQFDIPTLLNGTTTLTTPANVVTLEPRANATATATIGGTVTTGSTVSLVVTQGQLPGGAVTYAYHVVSGDTLATIAEGLASLIAADPIAQAFGIYATTNEAVLTVNWPGPAGNFAVLTGSASAGETVTTSPANGVMSGGTGPIIPTQNFEVQWTGSTLVFWQGMPRQVDYQLLSTMIAQGLGNFV
jgi:hypothetical protein